MATTFLAATPIQDTFFLPGTNTPGNGVQLFCYAAGSSTKTTVFKDGAGATPWTNPIVLDSGGNLPAGAEVWQTQGQSMKYVYAPSNDTDPPASPYRTLDNMPGTNDVSGLTGVEWLTGPTPTFVNATSFTLVGDQTATFTKGRRVKTTNTGGTVYSTIVGSAFGALTTITLVNDSGSLDAGLSAVSYGLFDPANVSIGPSEIYRKGASVSSATNGTTDIWGIVGDYVHITGTTGIRHFSSAPYAGAERTVVFDGALTVFSSAALTIPGNTNLSTAANDIGVVRADTTNTHILTQYTKASGLPLSGVQVSSSVYAGPSSGANAIPTFRALSASDGGTLVLLNSTSAASSASIDFSSTVINSAYDEYVVQMLNVVGSSTNAGLIARVSTSNAVSFFAAGNDYAYVLQGIDASGASINASSAAANGIALGPSMTSSANAGGICTKMNFFNPSNTSFQKMFQSFSGGWDVGNVPFVCTGNGVCINTGAITGAINGLRFLMNSGNINRGDFYIYGVRKS